MNKNPKVTFELQFALGKWNPIRPINRVTSTNDTTTTTEVTNLLQMK